MGVIICESSSYLDLSPALEILARCGRGTRSNSLWSADILSRVTPADKMSTAPAFNMSALPIPAQGKLFRSRESPLPAARDELPRFAKKREFLGFRAWIAWMSRKKESKAPAEGGDQAAGPFGALDGLANLPAGPGNSQSSAEVIAAKTSQRGQKNTNRGRVDIVRQTAHRGGKGVTVAKNFKGIGLPEKQELAKLMQKACGVGGTVKDGCIEIQGDKRGEMKRILTEAGFNPVFAGG